MISKANKAALTSAMVFPGAGLLLVKAKWEAAIIMLAAFMNLSVIGSILYETVYYRMEQMMFGLNSLSGNAQSDLMAPLPAGDAQTLTVCLVFLAILWAYSIIYGWHKGRILDERETFKKRKQAEAEASNNRNIQ